LLLPIAINPRTDFAKQSRGVALRPSRKGLFGHAPHYAIQDDNNFVSVDRYERQNQYGVEFLQPLITAGKN